MRLPLQKTFYFIGVGSAVIWGAGTYRALNLWRTISSTTYPGPQAQDREQDEITMRQLAVERLQQKGDEKSLKLAAFYKAQIALLPPQSDRRLATERAVMIFRKGRWANADTFAAAEQERGDGGSQGRGTVKDDNDPNVRRKSFDVSAGPFSLAGSASISTRGSDDRVTRDTGKQEEKKKKRPNDSPLSNEAWEQEIAEMEAQERREKRKLIQEYQSQLRDPADRKND
ncbi:hypothetical protein LTR64_004501 [Lithohypha guttulata]|uniref:uncharacterized protein n=1 Tax=Lithohypha guttulata TaxID=1690604 RepID=UPI00315D0DF2